MIKIQDTSAGLSGTRMDGDTLLVEARCARTGCQTYRASDLGLGGDHLVQVYRPTEVVFDKESMRTFAGVPVTMGHPDGGVSAETWKKDAIGEVQDTVARDGESIRVTFRVRDADAIRKIKNGTREISMGYSTGVEIKDGIAPDGTEYQAVQTGPIEINHLAIVDKARGGSSLRIGDSNVDGASRHSWGVSPVTVQDRKEKHMSERTILVDGLQVPVTDASEACIKKLQSQLADAQAETDKAKAEAKSDAAKIDKEMAAKDAEIDNLKKSQMSVADIDAKVEARAELLDTARKIDPNIEIKGLSDTDIRKAVVVAKIGDSMAGKSDEYIEGRFEALAQDAGGVDGIVDHLKAGGKPSTGQSLADQAHSEMVKELRDAWAHPLEQQGGN